MKMRGLGSRPKENRDFAALLLHQTGRSFTYTIRVSSSSHYKRCFFCELEKEKPKPLLVGFSFMTLGESSVQYHRLLAQ
jgi:hypothetical protein